MDLSELYPKFSITDEWGRDLEFNCQASGYTRKITNVGVPGLPLGQEAPVSRVNYALAFLDAVEREANGGRFSKKPHKKRRSDPSDTPTLDAWFKE